jgi:hypothetical protein
MAQLVTENITVQVSRLVRNNEVVDSVASEEFVKTLEEVAQQLVPAGSIVEVTVEQS